MRSVQLFLCLVASACVASKYIKDVQCTQDGGCEWSPNSQKDTPKLWDDAITNALNTVSQLMNTTGPYEFSDGNRGNQTLTQETTYGELVGNKMTMEMMTEVTQKGTNGAGQEYAYTMTVAFHQESYLEDLVISWHQVGEGQMTFMLPESDYSVTGNVSILGSGSQSTHSTGITVQMEEMTQILEMPGQSIKSSIFNDYTFEDGEEQIIMAGYSITTTEAVVPPEASDILPNPLKKVFEILFPQLDASPKTTYISEVNGELPLNGKEGPLKTRSTGVMHVDGGESGTFVSETTGFIQYVSEDTNNAIGKGYLPKLPMRNLPLFH